MHREAKNSFDLLHCNIDFIAVFWNQTCNISHVCLYHKSQSRTQSRGSQWWAGESQDSQPQVHVLALGLKLEIPLCLPAAQAGLSLLGPAPDWVGGAESPASRVCGEGRGGGA